MTANGGASMVVSSQTSATQQQAYAAQVAYNMQNNLPVDLHATPGDAASNTIVDSIMSQAQVIAMTPQTAPTVATQVAASTTGSNPAGMPSNVVGSIADGQWTPNPNNPLQKAQVGSGAAVSSAIKSAASPVTSWIQDHAGNYGLVILGALLVLGALLISQRKNIETIVTTAGKAAAIAA